MKKKILIGLSAGFFTLSLAHAQETSSTSATNSSVQAQIDELKAEVIKLQTKIDQEQNNKTLTTTDKNEIELEKEYGTLGDRLSGVRNLGLGTGRYYGLDSDDDGSQLLITAPQLNKDYNLLITNQLLDKRVGLVSETGARVQLSGTIQASAVYNTSPFGQIVDDVGEPIPEEKSDLLGQAEFDIAAEISDWWTGYMHFYSGTEPGDSAKLEQAFITVGDLDQLPTFASAGLYFLPSGYYYTNMVSRPQTREVGRSRDNVASITTVWKSFRGTIFGFDSERQEIGQSDTLDQFGASLDYTQRWTEDLRVRMGVGYVNDNSGAEGIAADDVLDIDVPIKHYIPSGNVYGRIDYRDFIFYAEYQDNFKSFQDDELAINGEGAKISAANFEITYNFDWGRKSWITVNYGLTTEALGAQLPERVAGITYGVNVAKNTVISFEYLNQQDYSDNDVGFAASNPDPVLGTGDDNNQFIVQVDLFF